jgi:hypothetical protein
VVPPPVDTSGGPVVVPVHTGLAFGPFHLPKGQFGNIFSAALRNVTADSLIPALEVARRANLRILLTFTGSEWAIRDENGFSLTKWQQRVDRFRRLNLAPYIADGTIIGHFIMDEPSDPTNWNGHPVPPATVDEMARYSKSIWPDMPTVIRGWPAYLKGYQYQYLDAAWAQYHERFGPIDAFISTNIHDAQAAGLALVAGLNVLNGGTSSSGIPGKTTGKFAMSASELRTWGNALLSEPYFCALFMWQWDDRYFSRPDIKSAMEDLETKARNTPKKECHR